MDVNEKLTIHQKFRAQFGQNQSIFNTPNPRLMNVSVVNGISFKRKTYGEGIVSCNMYLVKQEPMSFMYFMSVYIMSKRVK